MIAARTKCRAVGIRWLKFNAVGGMGIAVQLIALAAFKSGLHWNYLFATAIAVEAAILHNFIWHKRFTWVDRSQRKSAARLLKFNLTTGVFSLAANLTSMKILVGLWHLEYLVANCAVIAACSLLNFVVSDRFVFRPV
jgi:putative flippase GtrA